MFPVTRIPIYSWLPQLVLRSFPTSPTISFSNIHENVWEDTHFNPYANQYHHLHQDAMVYQTRSHLGRYFFTENCCLGPHNRSSGSYSHLRRCMLNRDGFLVPRAQAG